MKIGEAIKLAKQKVGTKPDGDLAIDVLLSFCLKMSREELFLAMGSELPVDIEKKFTSLLGRFEEGEPVAYLINNKQFYGIDLFVDERVLTPRPETEILVDKVLEYAKGRGELKVLDVGTGSGNIAIAVALNNPALQVSACDVSESALQVARINLERYNLQERVNLFNSDLLSGVTDRFDVIVANLPYIGTERFNFVSKETYDFEPHVALFGGQNGLQLYDKLFSQIAERDWRPSLLLGEFGFLQTEEMELLLDKYFKLERRFIVKDYASIDRVFMVNFA
ncbi:peptide chain release factor N(5)-glutamine methyltransferase [Candidatus Gracilibacteria bacterium]|nr:peptide chain release factor N(5)-glutamine methyltransferase [Candidatus Gracilibacteria bacterium]